MKLIYDNDFFEKILEASHDEIFVCDKDGYMVFCNKAFESNYGINRHEMIGKTAMFLNEAGYSNQTPIPYVVKHGKKVSIEQKILSLQNSNESIFCSMNLFDYCTNFSTNSFFSF